jgi:hypothetical protein
MYKKGSNYANDIDNADVITLDAKSPALFQYRFSNGDSGVLTQSLIDPDNLDDGAGGLTAVGNNKWSVQRGYIFTSNNLKFQRGVSEYASLDEAVNGIATEPYVTEPSIAANGLLRGWLVVKQSATDLSDGTQALFLEAPKFPGGTSAGGASVTTLQAAYDNSTPDPEILTDSTNGAVTFRRGSALDTDKVLTVQSGSGDDVFYVDGLGNVVGNSITASIDYSNINNVPDFVESSETSSMTVLSASYAITASYALNAGGGNAYISQSGQNADLGVVTTTGLTVVGDTVLSGSLTTTASAFIGSNINIGYNNSGILNSDFIQINAYNASGSSTNIFGLNNTFNQIAFGPFSDPLIDRITFNAGDGRNEWSVDSSAGTYIFNVTNQDRNFIIRGSGSGDAYFYDAGIHKHTTTGDTIHGSLQSDKHQFTGSLCVTGSFVAIDADILLLNSQSIGIFGNYFETDQETGSTVAATATRVLHHSFQTAENPQGTYRVGVHGVYTKQNTNNQLLMEVEVDGNPLNSDDAIFSGTDGGAFTVFGAYVKPESNTTASIDIYISKPVGSSTVTMDYTRIEWWEILNSGS